MHAGLTLFRAPLAVLGLLMGLAVSGCTTTATVGATAKGLQQQADAVLAPPTLEDWLRPHLDSGALVPILEPWWQTFSGPFLYYPGRRYLPSPLRAFVDFIKAR